MTKLSSAIWKLSRGSNLFQYLAAIAGNLGIICSEMHYGWPSPSLPILRSGNYTFQISSEESSWLVVAPLIGAIPGALITGFIVDIIGRKKLILFTAFPFIASWLLIAWAESSVLMFISRTMAGMTDGISFTAVPMYLGEIADRKIRGVIASMCPVCIILGIFIINALGLFLSIPTTAYIGVTFPVVLLITFIWMPESPYFHLLKGKVTDAKKSLQIFRGKEDVSAELARIAEAIKEQNENRGKWSDLLTVASNRRAVIIAFGLRTVQQLSGTTVIMYYCKQIFTESSEFISPSVSTLTYLGVQLMLSVVASMIVDVSGRRPLLLISITGTVITLLTNGTYLYIKERTSIDISGLDFLSLVSLLMFVIMFSIGLQTIPLLVMGEMFPTNVKAFAMCSADIYYNMVVVIVAKLFHWSMDAFGLYVSFFAFSVASTAGLIFIIFCVPETKGKTLEDIQLDLKRNNK